MTDGFNFREIINKNFKRTNLVVFPSIQHLYMPNVCHNKLLIEFLKTTVVYSNDFKTTTSGVFRNFIIQKKCGNPIADIKVHSIGQVFRNQNLLIQIAFKIWQASFD